MDESRDRRFSVAKIDLPYLTSIFLVVVVVMALNAALLWRSITALRGNQAWVTHTHEVLSAMSGLEAAMTTAAAAHHGLLLSGDATYRATYLQAQDSARQDLRQVQELTADNPAQQQRSATIADQLGRAIALLDATLAQAARDGSAHTAAVTAGLARAKPVLDDLGRLIGEARTEEQRLRQRRVGEFQDSSAYLNWSLAISTALNILLALATYLLIRRQVQGHVRLLAEQRLQAWYKSGIAALGDELRGDQTVAAAGSGVLAFFARYLNLPVATFSLVNGDFVDFVVAYGGDSGELRSRRFRVGDGLAGEAVRQRRVIHTTAVPETYLNSHSTIGAATVTEILSVPVLFEGRVLGVLEFGTFGRFTARDLSLVEQCAETLGIGFNAAMTRELLQEVLAETQAQAEELQTQQEELRTSNEELAAKSEALNELSKRLMAQQDELRRSNEQLAAQTQALEAQRATLDARNAELTAAHTLVKAKAKDLELASQYKSEFLANMSHELRTPLNSMLILATLLAENKAGRLDAEQVEFARTIFAAGNDLLTLINDILDLSKVESGKLELHREEIVLSDLALRLERIFRPVAEQKHLQLGVDVAAEVTPIIVSDRLRLEQVLKNFLGNAVKFTLAGRIRLHIYRPRAGFVAFAVQDTGVGIPSDKQEMIFEAFQQVDGSTSRNFGGTGLGLTISRELTQLLGGEILLTSAVGRGSTFTLVLPESMPTAGELREEVRPPDVSSASIHGVFAHEGVARSLTGTAPTLGRGPTLSTMQPLAAHFRAEPPAAAKLGSAPLSDDRSTLKPGDRSVLIVEDDPAFSAILANVAREAGFRVLRAGDGASALATLAEFVPSGVVLDLLLPDRSGLEILEAVKEDPRTRHLPVHVVSGLDHTQNALRLGAVGYLVKPATADQLRQAFGRIETVLTKRVKRVMVIEDDDVQRAALCRLIGGQDIETLPISDGEAALAQLRLESFDCLILDLRLPGLSGFEFLQRLHQDQTASHPPVVVYTGKDLTKDEEAMLRRYSDTIILKGARSPERLLDEVSRFLHRVEVELPEASQAMLQAWRSQAKDKAFAGRTVLLVDDDMRNVFALVSALESKGLNVKVGRNGREAVTLLAQSPDVDLVLMDIMMPVMDGFEAMGAIRRNGRFAKLPIIALTAKAMKGDQDKCLAAGASDYLAKPVNLERLDSLLRVWLPAGDTLA